MADDIASHLPLKVDQKQAVLECLSPKERLEKVCMLLMKEIEILSWRGRSTPVFASRWRGHSGSTCASSLRLFRKSSEIETTRQEIAELREKVESLGMPEEALEKAQKR